MVKNREREKVVQQLSAAAQACGVEPVRGDAGRPKVQELIEAVRSSAGPATTKAAAEDKWTAYEATFSTGEAPAPSQGQAKAQGQACSGDKCSVAGACAVGVGHTEGEGGCQKLRSWS